MADFLTNLWESVFTPGTTPTLLIATNVAFGALQLLLAALLFATYSIHFAILSVLCGGLWYSINWFARELQAAQAKEAEAERLRRKKRSEDEWKRKGDDNADDEGEDTEVESGLKESFVSLSEMSSPDAVTTTQSAAQSGVATASALRRRVDDVDRSGDISTDSEWEKVDE